MKNQIESYFEGKKQDWVGIEEMDTNIAYKQSRIHLGSSDSALLEIESPKGKDTLKFIEDGSYKAYVVDETVEIPSHYTEVYECNEFLKIKDDDSWNSGSESVDVNSYYIFNAEWIKVFRAGDFGCIIQMKRN